MKNEITLSDPSFLIRRYDLDWLRVIAFGILIFFHVGMFFNHWEWHIKNNELTRVVEWPMRFTSQWRMSLLFMISGASVYFALGNPELGCLFERPVGQDIGPATIWDVRDRPAADLFRTYHPGLETYSYPVFFKTVFQFVPYPRGSFSWHHLWYLAYIFFYSLLGLPLLLVLRRAGGFTAWLSRVFSNPANFILLPVMWHVGGNLLISRQVSDYPPNLTRDWNEHFH